ncbi:MAG: DUF3857 domain-containing protein [Armatimonadetes bacterium]|nr:DUF3857 domain-containing protein [Armatimonadota bacterium]
MIILALKHHSHWRLLAAALLCALPWRAAAASPVSDGWQRLWKNDNPGARAAFQAALKQNPADLDALRGLATLHAQADAPGAALDAWARLYRAAPAHWSVLAYWPWVLDAAYRTGRWATLNGMARAVLAAPQAPPELRASARLVLADAADGAGKPAEADRQRAALGFIRKWRIIGPFDNVSLSGFEKVYPPEREVDLQQAYPGKDDQEVRWYPLAIVSRHGECAVGLSLGDGSPGVYYAATSLLSPREQSVLLRLDPAGASKVWVNGTLVFFDEGYRTRVPYYADPYRAAATLRKGRNTLLVKLADRGTDPASFSLRLTTPAGASVMDAQADPAQAAGRIADAARPAGGKAESAYVSFLRRASPVGDPEAALLTAFHLFCARDLPAAVATLRPPVERLPESGWLRWHFACALGEDEQIDAARAERDLARKRHGGLIDAELAYLQDEAEAAAVAPEERIRRLRNLLKVNPGSAGVHWALVEAYDAMEMAAEARKAARAAVSHCPGPGGMARLVAHYLAGDHQADAEKALAQALRATPNNVSLLESRARLLKDTGKTAAAIGAFQRLLQANMPSPWYRLALADLYESAKDLKRAAAALRAARAQRPLDAAICARLGDLLRQTGSKAEAIDLYRKAIRLDPAQVVLRDKLRLLTGEKPVADLAPPLPAAPILAKASSIKATPGASCVFLLDEARVVVHPDGALVARSHQIVKVFDQAGVSRFQRFSLAVATASSVATVESARIIKPDGKIENAPPGFGRGVVDLPSLAPGDVIDVAYRVEDYQRGGLARQFWTEWDFDVPDAPSQLCRYVLITPPAMPLRVQAHGDPPEPTVKDVNGWRVREWRTTDLPPRRQEPDAPPRDNAAIWLDISTIPSWAHVVRWYRDLAAPRCAPDEAVRARATELTKGATTEEEKIRALVRYVARDIQYQSTPFRLSAYVPTEGKQVIRERYGDCKDKSALAVALLESVGIKAEMVLLSGRSGGTTSYLPSPRFTHAVALVHASSGPLWVDATADQMEFGNFPQECQGVPALIIGDATTDLTVTPTLPVERSRASEEHECRLAPDGRLDGAVEFATSGDMASQLRSLVALVPEGRHEEMLQEILPEFVENPRFDGGSVENLADPDKPLILKMRYHAERHGTEAGNFLLVRLPWGSEGGGVSDSVLANSSRTQDIELGGSRGCYHSSVRLALPPGYVVQDLQTEVKRETPWGSYRITYRVADGVLHGEREVRILSLRVPAAEAAGFIEFARALLRDTGKGIVLRKEPGSG